MFAWMAAGLFLAALVGGLLLLPRPSAPAATGRFVAIYATDVDLPGGFERVKFTLAAATVGTENYPLQLEVGEVVISDHHGPAEAVRVASGTVPFDAVDPSDRSVSLIFDGAQGFKDGAWHPVEVPQHRLTVPEALAPGEFEGHAVVFDFNLDASLVEREGGLVSFHPFLQTVYNYGQPSPLLDIDVRVDAAKLLKVDLPEQVLDDLSRRIVDDLCERSSLCLPTSPSPPTLPPSAPFPSSSLVASPSSSPKSSASGSPPRLAIGAPEPGDGAAHVSLAPTLRWQAQNANAATRFSVRVDGAYKCVDVAVAARSCLLANLQPGSEYRWRVSAEDGMGGLAQSPEWRFRTSESPNPAQLVSPAHQSTGQSPDAVTLQWSGSDPDGDALTYTVWMGVDNPPTTTRCNGIAATQCTVSPLAGDKDYYWFIRSNDGESVRDGPVWTFKTRDGGEQPGACPPFCLGG